MVFNPLLDKHPIKNQQAVTASVKSPISGKDMIEAYCGDIPVVVDLESRAVLPIKNK